MATESVVGVPDRAVVSSHTNELAGTVASLKEVTTFPLVVELATVPPVTTSFPALLRSVWCRIVVVTEVDPVITNTNFVIVIASGVKNMETSSEADGDSIVIFFE